MGLFPSSPTITECNLPDQFGKVFVVTGSTSGIGRELAHILYAANAKVWIVARSETKANEAISAFRTASPNSQGSLEFLKVDFGDLRTIEPAVADFLKRESRIDVS